MAAESVIDPSRQNRVLVPMGRDGLYVVELDPATGAFPTATPLRISNDSAANTAFFLDGLELDSIGNLFISNRDTATNGSMRIFSEAELVAAEAGTPITIQDRTAYYSGTDIRVARDIAVPEPATAGVLGLAAAGLLGARRRRRQTIRCL